MVTSLMSVTFLTLFAFNNCSDEVAFSSHASSKISRYSSNSILINDGDAFTNKLEVRLNLSGIEAQAMYITNDPKCESNGSWEPFSDQKVWSLSQSNSQASVFVKFRDIDKSDSTCLSDSIVHDNIAPVVSFSSSPSVQTSSGNAVFEINVADQGSGLERMECKKPGSSSFVPCQANVTLPQLSEGVKSFSGTAMDKAGNWSEVKSFSWVVDQTAPILTLNLAPSSLTSSQRSRFEFSAIDSFTGVASYSCQIDSVTTVDCSEFFETTLNRHGTHQFKVTATDGVGNTSDPTSFTWNLDLKAPNLTILEKPSDITKEKTALFRFEGMDDGSPISQFSCSLDGSSMESCNSGSRSYPNLNDGVHVFNVKGRDTVGHWSTVAAYSWRIDTVAPTLSLDERPDAITSSTSAQFTFNYADTNGSGIKEILCSVDGGTPANCSAGLNLSSLAPGNHAITATTEDFAGNSSAPLDFSWSIDIGSPEVEVITSLPSFLTLTMAEIRFQATDVESGISNMSCTMNQSNVAACTDIICSGNQVCKATVLFENLVSGLNILNIKAFDLAGNVGEVTTEFFVDNAGPTIQIIQAPAATIDDITPAIVEFSVTDSLSGVGPVACSLNEAPVPCSPLTPISFSGLSEGPYQLKIRAEDLAGNVTEKTVSWSVGAALYPHTQLVHVDGTINTVDILFVVDNSGSMSQEQANLGERIGSFVSKISQLNWQIGITTTDQDGNRSGGDGTLLNFPNGSPLISSDMDPVSAQEFLSTTLQTGTGGSGRETGIRSTYRAIERTQESLSSTGAPATPGSNDGLVRPGAALAVILISDEDESESQFMNMPANLIQLVQATWPDKPFSFHSIIWIPGDTNCSTGAVQGHRYKELSEMTGGIVSSVCSGNYGPALASIGDGVGELVRSVLLECAPKDTSGNGDPDVEIQLGNGQAAPSFVVSGQLVTFSEDLPPGNHQFQFSCLN